MTPGSRKRTSDAGDTFIIKDDGPQPKRTKTDSAQKATSSKPHQPQQAMTVKVDSNGDKYWEISKMRRVTVSSFRGKTMVNIREYYEKDGQELPGKKGISLPVDQFASFVNLLPGIEATLKEHGESIPRPNYIGISGQIGDGGESTGDWGDVSGDSHTSRKNIDATSEEDVSEE